MNWIKQSIVFLLSCLCLITFINPKTMVYFDSSPPLSENALLLISVLQISLCVALFSFLFLRQIFNFGAISIATFIVVEIVFKTFFHPPDPIDFLVLKPVPYHNAEYFTDEFLKDLKSNPGGWTIDKQTGVVRPFNYQGRFINVRDHKRVTTNTPKDHFLKTIYLFGGSTVYSAEVPDSETIASHLAKIIPDDKRVNVVNMGATSIHSAQQLARLKSDVTLKRGDIVIFYDGVNDVNLRVILNNQKGFMYGDPSGEGFLIGLTRALSAYSSFAKYLIRLSEDSVREFPEKQVQKAAASYLQVLLEAKNYSDTYDSQFFHFLQPTLLTKNRHSDYEVSLISRGAPTVAQVTQVAFNLTYPVFAERLKPYDWNISLLTALDGVYPSPYFDFCHLNHIGNRIIAEYIYQSIVSKL